MALTLSPMPASAVRSETALVAAARDGDDRAFGELYSRYRERIFAFVVSRVHDHGRAEDIVQEVFLSALRQLRNSDREIAFKPWIYAVAKNACIDEFRRAGRGREVSIESAEDLGRRPMLSAAPSPPAAAEDRQRLDDLWGAFRGLSENHHRMLVMREFEGRSYDEIGERLGMTRQMVESGLFRARRKLSEEYQELGSGRRCAQIQGAIEAGCARSIRSLGLRERRRLTRHLSHCRPCRHQAQLAGVDAALLTPRRGASKIAALLPFGLWRWPWGRGRGPGSGDAMRNAVQLAEPVGSSSVRLGQAAAAAAALALGAGGGIVAVQQHGATPRHVPRAPHLVQPAGAGAAAAGSAGPGRAPATGGRAASAAHRTSPRAGRATHAAAQTRPRSGLAGRTITVSPAGQAAGGRGRLRAGTGAGHTGGRPRAGPLPSRPGPLPSRPGPLPSRPVIRPTVGHPTIATAPTTTSTGASRPPSTGPSTPTTGTTSPPPTASSPVNSNPVQTTVNNTAQNAAGAVNNTAQNAAGAVNNTAQNAPGAVNNTAQNAPGAVNNTAQNAPGAVNNTAHNLASTVNHTTQSLGSTVNHTTQSLGSTVNHTTQSLGSTVSHTLGSVLGSAGSTPGPSPAAPTTQPPASKVVSTVGDVVNKLTGGLLP